MTVMSGGHVFDSAVAKSDDSLSAAGVELENQIDRLAAIVDLADSRLNSVQKFTADIDKDTSPVAMRGESMIAQKMWTHADQVRRATNILEAIISRLDL